mmetsp:Transcript_101087/g.195572  ORF Transcript_101087/g.195572 Transcript_101087/m.195572 type:complete len:165 (+) Transcript_101087:92-586(+)
MHHVWGSEHTSSSEGSIASSGDESTSAATAASGCGQRAEQVSTEGGQGIASGDLSQQGLPSQGSSKHESGNCRPCRFFNSKAGCRRGFDCTACHLHDGAIRKLRPNPERRAKAKSHVNSLRPVDTEALQEFTNKGGYAGIVARRRMMVCAVTAEMQLPCSQPTG